MVDVKAEIYTSSSQFLFVKVILDGGMYISGIKVSVSTKYPDQIWIQMPSYKAGKGWKRYIEVAGDCKLGKEIYRVVEECTRERLFPAGMESVTSTTKSKDVVLTDFDENQPPDFSEIPF